MKKLLLILLFLPLLFTTCKKEEDESNNNGNNTSNFLDTEDGSVWYLIGDINPTYSSFDTLGFFNSTYFYVGKMYSTCEVWKFGDNTNSGNTNIINVTTINHNSNSILFKVVDSDAPEYEFLFEYIKEGDNSIKFISTITTTNMTEEEEFYYTKSSTETNLSCN